MSWGGIPSPLFVTDGGNALTEFSGSLYIFARPLASNQAPMCVISASANNGLSTPQAIAMDAAGDLYIANAGNNSITVYQPPAPGTPCASLTPVTTIYGGERC